MKFSILINLDHFGPNEDMSAVLRHRLELVQIADRGGFDISWTAEDHTGACFSMPHKFTVKSLQIFCDEVIPHFRIENAAKE